MFNGHLGHLRSWTMHRTLSFLIDPEPKSRLAEELQPRARPEDMVFPQRKSRETRVRLEWLGSEKWRQRRPSKRVAPVSGWKSSRPGALSTQRVEVLSSVVSGTQKLIEPSGRSYMPSTCGRMVAISSDGVCTLTVGTHAYQTVSWPSCPRSKDLKRLS